MEKTSLTPPRPAPGVRTSFLVWVGLALLIASLAGVGWLGDGLHLPASAGSVPPAATRPTEPMPRRAVSFGFVDVKGGVIPLYPLQQGRVVKVEVQDKQDVTRGTVLFRMDSTLARETVAEAEADVVAAEAQLKQARQLPAQHAKQIEGQEAVIAAKKQEVAVAQLRRDEATRLFEKNLAREETVKMAEEALKGLDEALRGEKIKLEGLGTNFPGVGVTRAEQDLAARRARFARAKFGLDECTLKAPCDGTVLRLMVSEGETLGLNPRQPAVYFCPKKPRIIRAEVEQEFANCVVRDQTVLIQDDIRSGPTWRGKVVQVSDWFTQRRSILLEPLQFNDVRTLECLIELDPLPEPPRLLIGQRMRVFFENSAN
jgi:multidrug resistance efflux pump